MRECGTGRDFWFANTALLVNGPHEAYLTLLTKTALIFSSAVSDR